MTKQQLIIAGWTVVFLAGVLVLSYGCWLAWHPAGFMVAGVFLGVLGFGGGVEQLKGSVSRR